MAATKTINIRIPKELEKDLASLSKEEDIPVSEIVRMSLRKFITLRRFRALHKKTVRYARKAGYMTEEEILNLK
ncbi:MAG: hypothetical protein GX606_03290 [Elusimicrobia bacterium]|nr:hypothetical protein [Elusimicrobiota bacterium]